MSEVVGTGGLGLYPISLFFRYSTKAAIFSIQNLLLKSLDVALL